jgi:hypothetical protein
MFLTHIALMLEAMAMAGGLVALHFGRQLDAKLITAAGVLLLFFGISSVLCTSVFAVKYSKMGLYDHPPAVGQGVVTH